MPGICVDQENAAAVELLLENGADARLKTRIDDCETPREMAERAGLRGITELLAKWEARVGR